MRPNVHSLVLASPKFPFLDVIVRMSNQDCRLVVNKTYSKDRPLSLDPWTRLDVELIVLLVHQKKLDSPIPGCYRQDRSPIHPISHSQWSKLHATDTILELVLNLKIILICKLSLKVIVILVELSPIVTKWLIKIHFFKL